MKTKTFEFSTKGLAECKRYYHKRTIQHCLVAAVILYIGSTGGMATVAFAPDTSLLFKVAFKIMSLGV